MKRIVLLLIIVCLGVSCEEYRSLIPYAPVNLPLNLNFQDNDLIPQLTYKTFTQRRFEEDRIGYGGILVINGFGSELVNLYAYDLSCPVEAVRNTRVVPNEDGLTATCPKCGASYNIANGYGIPISGEKVGLQVYRVVSSGNNQYRVSN